MRIILWLAVSLFLQPNLFAEQSGNATGEFIEWSVHSSLPPLPGNDVQPGLAGNYSGIIKDHLVVAGGANFPDALPWEGGAKKYWADVYIYPLNGSGGWTIATNVLPREMGYGVSVTLPDGILVIGGENSEGVYSDVFLMTLDSENNPLFEQETWP